MALLLYWFVCYDCTDGSIIKTIGSHGPIKTNVKNNRVVGTNGANRNTLQTEESDSN